MSGLSISDKSINAVKIKWKERPLGLAYVINTAAPLSLNFGRRNPYEPYSDI